MPVYHSTLNDKAPAALLCKAAIFPLKTKCKGPAPPHQGDDDDIVDEAIKFFRANVMFKKYEPEGAGDLVICYLTVYIGECIRLLKSSKTKADGERKILDISIKDGFGLPGDSSFPLNGFFGAEDDKKLASEKMKLKPYLRQIREETAIRLLSRLYNEDGSQNKWWFQFHKRSFMNIKST